MKLSPRSEAVAYRAWVEAEKVGWNLTVTDLAEKIGERKNVVLRIVSLKGWHNRLRASPSRHVGYDVNYQVRGIL